MDPEEAENNGKIEAMVMEIHFADPGLDDFVRWIAHNEDFEDEELTVVLSAVYTYAKSKNTVDGEAEEEDGSSEPD